MEGEGDEEEDEECGCEGGESGDGFELGERFGEGPEEWEAGSSREGM